MSVITMFKGRDERQKTANNRQKPTHFNQNGPLDKVFLEGLIRR